MGRGEGGMMPAEEATGGAKGGGSQGGISQALGRGGNWSGRGETSQSAPAKTFTGNSEK